MPTTEAGHHRTRHDEEASQLERVLEADVEDEEAAVDRYEDP
jgi:hypothetical protein